MADAPITLTVGDARAISMRACLACGASEAVAISLTDATISAEACGRREVGFAHLVDYLRALRAGRLDGQAEPVIARPLPAIFTCDARQGIAQLGFDRTIDDLTHAARSLGIAMFTQANSYSAGEIGYYVRRLSGAGLVALAFANAHAMVAPRPGVKPVFSTNPMAFGAPLPAPHPPLVFDQSSSATAFVNIARAAAEGRSIPDGWAVDADGRPTTDPAEAVLGALLPFGGQKGANIALMVEVMAAGLSGASWSLDAGRFHEGDTCPAVGLTVIAVAPESIGPGFADRLDREVQRLTAAGVHVPGRGARLDLADSANMEIEHSVRAAIAAASA